MLAAEAAHPCEAIVLIGGPHNPRFFHTVFLLRVVFFSRLRVVTPVIGRHRLGSNLTTYRVDHSQGQLVNGAVRTLRGDFSLEPGYPASWVFPSRFSLGGARIPRFINEVFLPRRVLFSLAPTSWVIPLRIFIRRSSHPPLFLGHTEMGVIRRGPLRGFFSSVFLKELNFSRTIFVKTGSRPAG